MKRWLFPMNIMMIWNDFFRPESVTMFDITNPNHSESLDKKVQTIVDGEPSLFSDNVSSYYTNYHLISTVVGSLLFIGIFYWHCILF